eukprot:4103271-Pleurochrysis_carterae.AAC.3
MPVYRGKQSASRPANLPSIRFSHRLPVCWLTPTTYAAIYLPSYVCSKVPEVFRTCHATTSDLRT